MQAYWSLGMGGTLITIGNTDETDMTGLPLFYNPLHCKSIKGTLYGDIEPLRDIPALADVAVRGDLRLDKIITKTFKIEEINDALDAMRNREDRRALGLRLDVVSSYHAGEACGRDISLKEDV